MANLTVTGTIATAPEALSTYHVTTELEAINVMLGAIGEQPVASIDTSLEFVKIAYDIFFDVSREIQARGWYFNEEDEYDLTVADGVITLPANTLKVIVTGETDWIVQRGTRLYNRTEHTYDFTDDVEATIVFFLAFTDLPQAARTYITLRAARKYQMKVLGSDSLGKFNDIDENQAWISLLAEEVDQAGYSMADQTLTQNRG